MHTAPASQVKRLHRNGGSRVTSYIRGMGIELLSKTMMYGTFTRPLYMATVISAGTIARSNKAVLVVVATIYSGGLNLCKIIPLFK